MNTLRHFLSIAFAVATCVYVGGCASERPAPVTNLQGENTQSVDFGGSWELDYSQSDNIQDEFGSLLRDLRQDAERRQRGTVQQGSGGVVINGNGANSGKSVVGLARMADMITQSPLLEVEQSRTKIRVKREENFSLGCEFHAGKFHSVETPFGTEICGWNSHQLVFKILLPDGLSIQHVMTLGASGQKLNIATTVVSGKVSYPFVLDRVYNRFNPGESGYRCTLTLTKGKVCTTESS